METWVDLDLSLSLSLNLILDLRLSVEVMYILWEVEYVGVLRWKER